MSDSDWMSRLPAEKRSLPLSKLYIPGSHDSFSCTLNEHSKIAVSAPKIVRILAKFLPIQPIVFIWSLTQRQQPGAQLSLGVRYFDVRVAVPEDTREIRTVHGLYGDLVENVLSKMSAWLVAHPTEVIFLDINHFYDFTDATHKQLLNALQEIFGAKLCPFTPIEQVTLEFMYKHGYQVIVFYQDSTPLAKGMPVWPSGTIVSPWANTDKIATLLPFLENALANRDQGQYFITQGILTPQTSTVIEKPCAGLEPLATLGTKTVTPWLKENFGKFKNEMNITICDFVSKENYCNTVIGLNFS